MLKRSFDILFTLIFLPLIFSTFAVVYIFALFQNKKDIFFFQDRGGYKGKKIIIIKFRTMEKFSGKISKFNNFLRKTRLDEIPQFFLVLKGDLSLVGPRPLHYEYKNIYSVQQNNRFSVRPGITGLAQISEIKNMTWAKQFEIDLWYVDNNSLLLDIKIIIKTLLLIVRSFNLKEIKDKDKFDGTN